MVKKKNKRKSQMGNLTGKTKPKVKAGNHPYTNMTSKLATIRRGKHKCRKWEIERPAS